MDADKRNRHTLYTNMAAYAERVYLRVSHRLRDEKGGKAGAPGVMRSTVTVTAAPKVVEQERWRNKVRHAGAVHPEQADAAGGVTTPRNCDAQGLRGTGTQEGEGRGGEGREGGGMLVHLRLSWLPFGMCLTASAKDADRNMPLLMPNASET